MSLSAAVTAVLLVMVGEEAASAGASGPKINRRPWPGWKSIALVKLPTIYTDAPPLQWGCMKRWRNPSDFITLLPAVQIKESSVAGIHYFSEGAPFVDESFENVHPGIVPQSPEYTERIVPADVFLNSLTGSSGSCSLPVVGYSYASGPVDEVIPPATRKKDLGGMSSLTGPGVGAMMNVWMATNGTIATAHYDTAHNFFIPVTGSKRFVLLPPEVLHDGEGIYPSLHPFRRHPIGDDILRRGDAEPRMVTVHPGELLFIPAYWVHQVESIGPSVALNVWKVSAAAELMGSALDLPLPFRDDWSQEQTEHEVGAYIRHLFKAAANDSRNGLRMLQLLRDRFRRIFGKLPRPANGCGAKNSSTFDVASIITSTSTPRLHELAAIFYRITNEHVRTLNLLDFAEQLVYSAVGAEGVPAFIEHCL